MSGHHELHSSERESQSFPFLNVYLLCKEQLWSRQIHDLLMIKKSCNPRIMFETLLSTLSLISFLDIYLYINQQYICLHLVSKWLIAIPYKSLQKKKPWSISFLDIYQYAKITMIELLIQAGSNLGFECNFFF